MLCYLLRELVIKAQLKPFSSFNWQATQVKKETAESLI